MDYTIEIRKGGEGCITYSRHGKTAEITLHIYNTSQMGESAWGLCFNYF